jgi:D-alanine-D-alanine ligase
MATVNSQFGKVAVLFGGKFGRARGLADVSGVPCWPPCARVSMRTPSIRRRASSTTWRRFDRAFIALHGRYGEDGTIQGALELMGIPYTGSGVMASAIGMDKWRTKMLWHAARRAGTPTTCMLAVQRLCRRRKLELGLPLFVKPACEGSSIGDQQGQAKPASWPLRMRPRRNMIRWSSPSAQSLAANTRSPFSATQALPIIKIEPITEFYDYEAKYLRDDTAIPLSLRPAGKP